MKVPVGYGITRDETHRYLPQRAPTRGGEATHNFNMVSIMNERQVRMSNF